MTTPGSSSVATHQGLDGPGDPDRLRARTLGGAVAVIALALVVTLLGLVVPLPAHASTTGHVTGHLTGTDPARSDFIAEARLIRPDGAEVASTQFVDRTTGAYSLEVVTAGRYTVLFTDGDTRRSQYWGGARDLAGARWFDVADGRTVTDVDAHLSVQEALAGHVWLGEGRDRFSAVGNADVSVLNVDTGDFSFALTDSNGAYSIAVDPGRYRIRASVTPSPDALDLSTSWFGGAAAESDATIVTVATDARLTGLDLQVEKAAVLTGSVTPVLDDPLDVGYSAEAWTTDSRGRWYLATGAAVRKGGFVFHGLPAGDYVVRVTGVLLNRTDDFAPVVAPRFAPGVEDRDDATRFRVESGETRSVGTVSLPPLRQSTTRISGPDRFAVAAAMSSQFTETGGTVVVANGLGFPDALSAGPAAAHLDAPLLLVTPTAIPEAVASELKRLRPKTVVVVGGAVSISADVEKALGVVATPAGGPRPTVVRVGGSDRYATSRAIARYAFVSTDAPATTTGVSPSRVLYLASGSGFADALSAGAAAADADAPLVMVDGQAGSADDATRELWSDLGSPDAIGVGGPRAMSAGIARSLSGTDRGSQIVGADRYEVSHHTTRGAFSEAGTAYLATGVNYPDALAGAALAARTSSPLFIVPGTCVPASILHDLNVLQTEHVVLLGGPQALSSRVDALTRC